MSITITQGQARGVSARVHYQSPDKRALLVGIDTDTKYCGAALVICGDESWAEVMLYAVKGQTLRWDKRYKRPTVVRVPLPKVKGYWFVEVTQPRYEALLFAVCMPPCAA